MFVKNRESLEECQDLDKRQVFACEYDKSKGGGGGSAGESQRNLFRPQSKNIILGAGLVVTHYK